MAPAPYLTWDPEKNALLQRDRGIGFEEIVIAICEGKLLEITSHPNAVRYPHQFQLTVWVNDHAYLVPYVEDQEKIFLKTIIPSRKATKKFLKQYSL